MKGFGFEESGFYIRFGEVEARHTDPVQCLDQFYEQLYQQQKGKNTYPSLSGFKELHEMLSNFKLYFCKGSK